MVTIATIAIASSLVKEAEGSIVGADRACSNRKSEENKCNYSTFITTGKIST